MPEASPPRVPCQALTYRLVPSHYPPIALFENLLDPDELDAAYQLAHQ